MLMLMSPESRVPAAHPIRRIKALLDDALAKLSSVFDTMYASTGRPSIPPEQRDARVDDGPGREARA